MKAPLRPELFLQGFLSSLIVAFGQPSFAPWLGPISAALGYALFWKAIRIYPFSRQRFWRGLLWYGCISLVQLSWMSAIEFQGPWMLLLWLILSIGLGAEFGLLSIFIPYNRSISIPRILSIASLWTLFEWSRFYVLCGYSWNLSGLALSNSFAMQFASVFGVLGLSFWVMLTNLFGLRAVLLKKIPQYFIWAGIAVFPYLFGMGHLFYHQMQMKKRTSVSPLSCTLIQPGLLPAQKLPLAPYLDRFILPEEQWKRILTLLKEEKSRAPQLIVLPESAVPFLSERFIYPVGLVKETFASIFGPFSSELFPPLLPPYGDPLSLKVSNAFWVQTLSNLFHSDVIIGLDHEDQLGQIYNSAFYAKPKQISLQRYDKQILMPIAEYLPFQCLLPMVHRFGIYDSFTSGKESKVFQGILPFAISICYEETLPSKIREGRKKGAKLLINLTNDGWYPSSRLPSQQYEHARFRAVENGIPLVRACNTGVSAVIDSFGKPLATLDELDPKGKMLVGSIFAKLDPYSYVTPYLLWGDAGIVVLCLCFLSYFICLKKAFRW